MIRIHTLGGLSVRGDDGKPLAGAAAQPRRMAILALLARTGERGITREKLLALLWPDADDERGPKTLAQALYALRKDLGSEEAITGAKDLRLDPALVSSDVGEFASTVSRGDDARAVALYEGPFLDGFHLPGSDQFSRWVETERAALAHDHARVLESLARAALARGSAPDAVTWWRKLAALEPLNARVTVGLMNALVAAGDRAAAIKHARIYELLVEQELDLPPDKDVMALAERLRQGAQGTASPEPVSAPAAPVAAEAPNVAAPQSVGMPLPQPAQSVTPPVPVSISSAAPAPRRSIPRWGVPAFVAFIAALAATFYALRDRRTPAGGATSNANVAVIAIGRIVAFGADSAQANMAAPVADLLATSLARARGVRVVSQGRMLELMRAGGSSGDTSGGAFVNAARRAGAKEIIDGTLYSRPDGHLRLDLRRVDLASGAIGDVRTIEGTDLFALVDSGTVRLVAALGVDGPAGSVADVTTRSVNAYRLYERGTRAYYAGDYRSALGYFDSAIAEDSLFALAAYYGALSAAATGSDSWLSRIERARQLATRAPDRERLTITADWAYRSRSPSLRQIAETLAVRYPAEVEGHLYSGIALVHDGQFLTAAKLLERVVAMDSSAIRGAGASCSGCEALPWLVSAYGLADSQPAAERVAREWLRLQPGSRPAANNLVQTLELQGRAREADSIFRATASSDLPYVDAVGFQEEHLIRLGDYNAADQLLQAQLRQGDAARQVNAAWLLTISLREQGRLDEAFEMSRRLRRFPDPGLTPGGPQSATVIEAQVQLERGRPAAAAALFDSIARLGVQRAATTIGITGPAVWMLTHAAGARVAAGDTAGLERVADSVRALGAASGYARDQRLYHHVRGMLLAARGRDDDATKELRAAIYSISGGYTRTNYELARILLRGHQPRAAIAVLQPALRGQLDGSNLYMNRVELHELLAHAWEAAGARDSAAAHYDVVARAWSAGDPPFKVRADSARAHASALKR